MVIYHQTPTNVAMDAHSFVAFANNFEELYGKVLIAAKRS